VAQATLNIFGMAIGMPIVFGRNLPNNYLPIILEKDFPIEGKHPDLVLLNDRPVNAETPPHLLNDQKEFLDVLYRVYLLKE